MDNINKSANSILYIDGVTVSFDGFKALNNLSFTVPPKSLQAIVGPNGAGKTTFMDVVTGRTKPTQGRVIFKENINLFKYDESSIVDLGIARKFQRPSMFLGFKVKLYLPRCVVFDIENILEDSSQIKSDERIYKTNIFG